MPRRWARGSRHAATYLPSDHGGLPTGPQAVVGSDYDFRTQRQIGKAKLDLAFTDLARADDARAWAVFTTPDGATARVWVDES